MTAAVRNRNNPLLWECDGAPDANQFIAGGTTGSTLPALMIDRATRTLYSLNVSGAVVALVPHVPTAALCALTGTITASATGADLVAGGKTIILTLTNDTWVASGATFNAQRQNIINGLVSAQSETHGWNAEVKAKIPVTNVVRTSSTKVTITLSAESGYSVSASETITATVPATAVIGATAIVSSPPFTVTANSAPRYNGVGLIYAGDDSNPIYNSLAAMGSLSDLTTIRLAPYPGPIFQSDLVVNPALTNIIASGGKTGGKYLKLFYTPRAGGQNGGHFGVVCTPAIDKSQVLYHTVWKKYSGSLGTGTAYKGAHVSDSDFGGGQSQWSTRYSASGAGHDPTKGTFYQFLANGVETTTCAQQPVGPYMEDLFDGQWHEFTYVWACHTSTLIKDGFVQLWIDGVLVIHVAQSVVGVTPAGGWKPWCTQPEVDSLTTDRNIDAFYLDTFGGTLTNGEGTWQEWLDINSFRTWELPKAA